MTNSIDYRQNHLFFTKFFTRHARNPERPIIPRYIKHKLPESPQSHCLIAVRHYPRAITNGSPESLTGIYSFETRYPNTLAGMSKLRAYRRARGMIQYARSYMGQSFHMFTGPKGILP